MTHRSAVLTGLARDPHANPKLKHWANIESSLRDEGEILAALDRNVCATREPGADYFFRKLTRSGRLDVLVQALHACASLSPPNYAGITPLQNKGKAKQRPP